MPTILFEKTLSDDALTDKWTVMRIVIRDGVYLTSLGVQGVLEYDEIRAVEKRLEIRSRLVFTKHVSVPFYGEPGSDLRRMQDAMVTLAGTFHAILLDEQRKEHSGRNPDGPDVM